MVIELCACRRAFDLRHVYGDVVQRSNRAGESGHVFQTQAACRLSFTEAGAIVAVHFVVHQFDGGLSVRAPLEREEVLLMGREVNGDDLVDFQAA
eukprot:scaffold2858_cov659-Pavlova_lutheri.AAC.99